MTLFKKKFIVGGVYKVARRFEQKELPSHYYCTVVKNPNKGKPLPNGGGYYDNAELHAYIPNEISRPLGDNYCELDERMEYVGTFAEYGHLLFNQQIGWHNNEYKTKLRFRKNLVIDLSQPNGEAPNEAKRETPIQVEIKEGAMKKLQRKIKNLINK